MKRPNSKISVVLVLTILFAAIVSCNFDEREKKTTVFDQYYVIESESLLDALERGEMNVFLPVDEQPEYVPSSQQVPVDWSQANYLYIVKILYKYVLGETLQGWQLNKMDFALGCDKLATGFQNGRFEFFKVVKNGERESRITRFIDIDPRNNFVNILTVTLTCSGTAPGTMTPNSDVSFNQIPLYRLPHKACRPGIDMRM